MKILMFGRGVISTLYGWALEQAGHTVDFYVRPGRAAQYGSELKMQVLDARKKLSGVTINAPWKISLREDLPADHDYDLILVSVQHYRFDEAAKFLAPRVGKATVFIFNNFWTEPQAAAAAFPKEQLVWGFPAAGGGFQPDGSLKGALLPMVQFGTFGTEPTARDLATRDVFRKAGFSVKEQRDFRGWLWIHFVTNAGLQAQVLKTGSMAAMVASTGDLQSAVLNVRTLLPLVAARGVDLSQHGSSTFLFKLPTWLSACLFRLAAKLSPPLRYVLEAHSNPEELRMTCRDALVEARQRRFPAPRLEALEAHFADPI
jgi:2-dehydropantoate 2-reductase